MKTTKELLIQAQDIGRRLAGISVELPTGQALVEVSDCERELGLIASRLAKWSWLESDG